MVGWINQSLPITNLLVMKKSYLFDDTAPCGTKLKLHLSGTASCGSGCRPESHPISLALTCLSLLLSLGCIRAQRCVQSLRESCRDQPCPPRGAVPYSWRYRRLPGVWWRLPQRPVPPGGRWLWAGGGEGRGHLYVSRTTDGCLSYISAFTLDSSGGFKRSWNTGERIQGKTWKLRTVGQTADHSPSRFNPFFKRTPSCRRTLHFFVFLMKP